MNRVQNFISNSKNGEHILYYSINFSKLFDYNVERRQPNIYSLVEIFLVCIKYCLQLKSVILHPLTT